MKTTAQRVLMSTKVESDAPKEAEDNNQGNGNDKPVCEQDQKESENEQNAAKKENEEVKLAKNEPENSKNDDSDDELPGWNMNISNYILTDDEEEKIELGEPLKAVIFDFDQTISVIHFYSDLNGYNAEKQLGCLNKWSDERVVKGFGGKERLQLLEGLFKDLKEASVELYILSFGHKEVIIKALERVNLLVYFDKNLIWGEAEVKKFRSDTGEYSQAKLRMILKLIREKHMYSPGEVLFVDDDDKNLDQSKKTICKTIHVSKRKGMKEKEIEDIRSEIMPSKT